MDDNASQIEKLINGIHKFSTDEVGKIESNTLNAVAKNIRAIGLRKEMQSKFDRATPYTLGSVFIQFANPGQEVVKLWIRDKVSQGNAPSKFLSTQEAGGQRPQKGFERVLQAAGILGQDQQTAPASGAPVNAYGNLTLGTVRQIIEAVRLQGIDGRTKKEDRAANKYRVVRNKDKKPFAVFVKDGSGYKPLLFFTHKQQFKKRFDFKGVVTHEYDTLIHEEYSKQFNDAVVKSFGG